MNNYLTSNISVIWFPLEKINSRLDKIADFFQVRVNEIFNLSMKLVCHLHDNI